MILDDMLSVLTALVGLFGLLFLTKGVLERTPNPAAENRAERAAGQKANMVTGAALVALALGFQFTNALFVNDDTIMTRTYFFQYFYWIDFLLACFVAFLIGAIALWKNRTLANRYGARENAETVAQRVDH